jgi:ABC-type molybdate transport system permease subunit
MGLWIGFVIALTLNNIAFYYINSNPSNLMLYIVLPVLSIGFGILILFIKRTFIIFASCNYLVI